MYAAILAVRWLSRASIPRQGLMYPQTQNIRRKTFRSPSKQRIWAKTPLQVFTIPSVTSNAALNYLLATGDTNPLEVITINPEFTKALLLFTDETGESQAAKSWYVSPQATLSLTSRMPTAVNRLSKRLAIHPRYQFGRTAGRQLSGQCNTCRAAEIPLCGYYPRHLRERSLVPHAHSS